MIVLVDTNVLISAALKDKNPESVILFVAAQPDWTWVVSTEILAEYREVLSRAKFGLPHDILSKWFDLLTAFTTLVQVENPIDFPRDQKDAKFLSCALATHADFLITGDRDLPEARRLVTTTILNVALFKKLVIGS